MLMSCIDRSRGPGYGLPEPRISPPVRIILPGLAVPDLDIVHKHTVLCRPCCCSVADVVFRRPWRLAAHKRTSGRQYVLRRP